VFSEPVLGFATGDVTIGGTAGATTATVTGGPTTYTIAVTGMTQSGSVSVSIPAAAAKDAANIDNQASTSSDAAVQWNAPPADLTNPTVTINQAAGQADPTSASSVTFTAVFSEPVTGFTNGDVTIGGTAGATAATVTGGPTTYTVSVSGMTQSGTVSASIGAGTAADGANNPNDASTSSDNTVQWSAPPVDLTNPTVAINQAGGQADPTSVSPILFTAVFSEPVTGFTTGDVTIGGTAGATTATVTGGPTTYTVTVSGMTQSGDVTVSVPAAAAKDAANLDNQASTSTDATVQWNAPPVDLTAPTVTINQAAGQTDPATTSPIVFDVVFSEQVTGFTATDVTLGGNADATTAVVSGSGATYTVSVTGMTQSGTVTASIPGSAAQDAATNPSAASTSTDASVTFDNSQVISTPGGSVDVETDGGDLTSFTTQAPSVAPPTGVTFPYGQLSFSANTTPGGFVTFTFTFPATVDAYYKLNGGVWEEFTWDGTTGAVISGAVVTITIQDNGRGDSDPALGVATDPGAPALDIVDTTTTTTTTTAGTTPTTISPSTTPSVTTPAGATTPAPTVSPTIDPNAQLPETGGSPHSTARVATLLLVAGIGAILLVRRRRPQAAHPRSDR
jgi:LPXTG-motif cell wall-anchored protein